MEVSQVQEMMQTMKYMGLGSVLNVALLGAVLWFLRRLILKVEKIDVLEVQVHAMAKEMKDVSHLRERVAVLEAISKHKRSSKQYASDIGSS